MNRNDFINRVTRDCLQKFVRNRNDFINRVARGSLQNSLGIETIYYDFTNRVARDCLQKFVRNRNDFTNSSKELSSEIRKESKRFYKQSSKG